jgi:hypothetical protein
LVDKNMAKQEKKILGTKKNDDKFTLGQFA